MKKRVFIVQLGLNVIPMDVKSGTSVTGCILIEGVNIGKCTDF